MERAGVGQRRRDRRLHGDEPGRQGPHARGQLSYLITYDETGEIAVNNLRLLQRALLGCVLATAVAGARADFDPVNDDTDIFLSNPNFTAQRPNVLIILDNTANWNTPFAAEKAALINAISGVLDDKFNVGLMMFTETGAGNTGNDGAYVR